MVVVVSRRLWLASLNAHKAEELGRMLVGHNVERHHAVAISHLLSVPEGIVVINPIVNGGAQHTAQTIIAQAVVGSFIMS